MAISHLDFEEFANLWGKNFRCLWEGFLYPTQDTFWTSPSRARHILFLVLGHKNRFRKFEKSVKSGFSEFGEICIYTFLKFPETFFMA